jgi:hypothetical protein
VVQLVVVVVVLVVIALLLPENHLEAAHLRSHC